MSARLWWLVLAVFLGALISGVCSPASTSASTSRPWTLSNSSRALHEGISVVDILPLLDQTKPQGPPIRLPGRPTLPSKMNANVQPFRTPIHLT